MNQETLDSDIIDNSNYETIDMKPNTEEKAVSSNDAEAHVKNDGEDGIMSKVRTMLTNVSQLKMSSEDDKGCLRAFSNKVSVYLEDKVQVETNYTTFFILLSIGLVAFCISLFILPFVLLSPGNFIFFFSIGCILMLVSFLFMYGTKEYLSKLFANERLYFTVLFLCSLIVGLISSLFFSSLLLSLICAVLQLISLLVFMMSFLPGGQTGISFLLSGLMYPINRLLGRDS